MAIFNWTLQTLSRSDARSAVAAAAYRAGAYLRDDRTGLAHDFSWRRGIMAEILLPADIKLPAVTVPAWRQEMRSRLWNSAEIAELRINSVVAREIVIALPHELGEPDRVALGRRYGQWLADRYRVATDVAWHPPSANGNQHNYHIHVMLTTREINDGLTLGRKTRILDAAATGGREITIMRAEWAKQANAALDVAGLDVRIDHRSLVDRGIDREPGQHLGPMRTNMIRAEEKKLATIDVEILATKARIAALRLQLAAEMEAERVSEQSATLRTAVVVIDEQELGPLGPYLAQAASPAGQRPAPPTPEPEASPAVTAPARRKRVTRPMAAELEAAVGEAIMAEVEQRNAAHAAAEVDVEKKRKDEEEGFEKTRKLSAQRSKPLFNPQAAKVPLPDETTTKPRKTRRYEGQTMAPLVISGDVTEEREEEDVKAKKKPLVRPPAGINGMSKGVKLAIGMSRGRGGKGRGGKGGRGR